MNSICTNFIHHHHTTIITAIQQKNNNSITNNITYSNIIAVLAHCNLLSFIFILVMILLINQTGNYHIFIAKIKIGFKQYPSDPQIVFKRWINFQNLNFKFWHNLTKILGSNAYFSKLWIIDLYLVVLRNTKPTNGKTFHWLKFKCKLRFKCRV